MRKNETNYRSFVKALCYRALIMVSTFLVSYFLTSDLDLSFGITFASSIANTLLYFIHERIWNRIDWGRERR